MQNGYGRYINGGRGRSDRQNPPPRGTHGGYQFYGRPEVRRQGDPRMNVGRDPRTAARQGASYRDPRYVNGYRQRPTEEELRREAVRRAEYARRRRAAMEMRRRVEAQIKREKQMRRKRQRKMLAARSVICLVVFALMATLFVGVLAAVFFSSPDGEPGKVKYYFNGKEVRTTSSDTAYQNGKLYICFNDISEQLGLALTGDTESMKFVFTEKDSDAETGSEGSGREEYVKFFIDSRTVELNGEKILLPGETYLYGESVWVSTEFVSEYIEGIEVDCSSDSVDIDRVPDPDVTVLKGEDPVYLPVGLRLKDHGTAGSPDGSENGGQGNSQTTPSFSTDLSAYEKYMDPEDAEEYLILVNYASTVDASLAPEDLAAVVNTRQDGRETQYLRLYAAKALEALYIEMYAAGYTDVSVMSGYRSYQYQSDLHEYYIEQEMIADGSLTYEAARQIVLTYSAAPGTSEHQTGLCVDMHNLPSASTEFKSQPSYIWLRENAWKFGFIERYPQNKTEETQISYEPWHWRYVGRTHAKAIYDKGVSLEEYIASLGE